MKILLIEAGSTKSDWVVMDSNSEILTFSHSGINPTVQSKSTILSTLESAKQSLANIQISELFFYGAGCKETASIMMSEMLSTVFSSVLKVYVYSDLLAAARSSCLGKKGVVAIVGTGSHSCLCDGHQIMEEKPSLGYLLGDEGSGNYYGKELLKAYFYKEFDTALSLEFEKEFPILKENFLQYLYSSPKINSVLAEFFPFLLKHKSNDVCQKIISKGILEFYHTRLEMYEYLCPIPLHFVGSVAGLLQSEYLENLASSKYNSIHFNPKPIAGLIQYHRMYA